jgi:hypothetical protein
MIALIKTPLQLICFSEFIRSNQVVNYKLIINSRSGRELIQVNHLAKQLDLDIYKIIETKRFYTYFSIFFYSLINFNQNQVLIGNLYDNHNIFFLKLFGKKKKILVDDGMATIKAYNDLNKCSHQSNIKFTNDITLFTFFNFPNSSNLLIKTHTFAHLKSKQEESLIKYGHIFIGQPLVETNIISQVDYLKYLQIIKRKKTKIYYLPHRRETNENIFKIIELGFELLQTDDNFELFLIKNNYSIKSITAFYSTSLITGKLLASSKTDINFFEIKESSFYKSTYSHPKLIYKELRNYNIKEFVYE